MRKVADILIILIIVAMTSIIIPYSQATTEADDEGTGTVNIEANLTPTAQVEQDAKTVVLILSLGKFEGIAENTALAYSGDLTYSANVFEKVEAEGMNGWIGEYLNTTKVIQGDTSSAKSNTSIAKITATLKDGIAAGTQGTITISNLEISDGTDATDHIKYTKTSTITIGSAEQGGGQTSGEPAQGGQNASGGETGGTLQQGNSGTPAKSPTTDKTTAKSTIPKAGTQNFLRIAIFVILAMGLFCLIRYKMIKLK